MALISSDSAHIQLGPTVLVHVTDHKQNIHSSTGDTPQDAGRGYPRNTTRQGCGECVLQKCVWCRWRLYVCEASREGEQMPAGHVISLTLGQSQWQPSQWKQRDVMLAGSRLGALWSQIITLHSNSGFPFNIWWWVFFCSTNNLMEWLKHVLNLRGWSLVFPWGSGGRSDTKLNSHFTKWKYDLSLNYLLSWLIQFVFHVGTRLDQLLLFNHSLWFLISYNVWHSNVFIIKLILMKVELNKTWFFD